MTSLERFLSDVGELYQQHIVDEGKQAQMLVLASFLVTFTIVRLITHAIRAGKLRHVFRNVQTSGGLHLHHLVIGILLLIGTGYVSVAIQPDGYGGLLAVLFGIGTALTLDEFALWLRLKDVYWAREGRASVDAVVVMASIITLGLIGVRFWLELGRLIVR
jgi:hypothetical protein